MDIPHTVSYSCILAPNGHNAMIQFLLNKDLHRVDQVDPNTMVLNYLRDHLQLCGNKEGCASGDCGACTLTIGQLDENSRKIHYHTINGCITLLSTLHGKQLLTIEALKVSDNLHPVQQAMVDCHGSQCGFCTPGFVMSLFTLYKNQSQAKPEKTLEALSGNLCRCTGYKPILNAAKAMYKYPADNAFAAQHLNDIQKLQQINSQQMTQLDDGTCHSFNPTSLTELTALLQQYPNASLVAGGTDLCLQITQALQSFETLIYLGNVKELLTVSATTESITIGAAVTYSQCFAMLEKYYPEMGQMLTRLGSLQIRNQGTLGGNIGNASPIGDMPPALIALGATLTLNRAGVERTLLVEDYFVDYKVTALQQGEFIQSITVPKTNHAHQFKLYKISKRIDDDISAVCAAFYLLIENRQITYARIAYGGMAAIPKRATHCEAALLNQPWEQDTIIKAAAALASDYTPLSDCRASGPVPFTGCTELIKKYFLEIQSPERLTRVVNYA